MATFWFWLVRNPMALLCVFAIASGYAEVLEWSPALALALPCALIAEAADWLGGRAEERAWERAERAERARAKVVPISPYLEERRKRDAA